MKIRIMLVITTIALMLTANTVMAYTEEDPLEITLLAGQYIDAGDVLVWNDADNIYVKYETNGVWELTETHLYVGKTNPEELTSAPGQFPYSEEHNPAETEWTYTIPLADIDSYSLEFNKKGKTTGKWIADGSFGFEINDMVYIAAHAIVQKETIITEAPYYAISVFNYSQGLRKDGTPVRPERSVPEQGLEYEIGRDEHNFFSLGFGGWIIMEFDCPIRNGEGNDLKVIEDTWGGNYPLEEAEVYASEDGINWILLGIADNTNLDVIHTISEFDLGDLMSARFIKIVDVTDPSIHNDNADGYDLNAVQALQDCIEIQEETGWGEGDYIREDKNWAMYYEYTIQEEQDLVDTIEVPAKGYIVSSMGLEEGKEYILEAVGTAFAGGKYTEDIEFDAKYSITHSKLDDTWTDTVTDYESYGTNLLELKVNDEFIDWGAYNEDHKYYWTLTGDGESIDLQIYDIYYPNNVGFLTVNIYELP